MSKIKKVEIEKVFELSPDEKDELARQSMATTDEFERLDLEYSDVKADFRRKLKNLRVKIKDLNKAYREGSQKRTVLCDEHINIDTKKATYVFEGAIVSERDLDMDEIAQHGTAPLFDDQDGSVQEVMAEETNKKTKRDLVAN